MSREVEFALPSELDNIQNWSLSKQFGHEISERYQIAIDLCFHDKRKFTKQDGTEFNNWNLHLHALMSACTCKEDGTLGKKVNEFDPIWCARNGETPFAHWARKRWAELVNAHLEMYEHEARISHLSLEDQDISRVPTQHRGPKVSSMLRRGIESEVANRFRAERDATKKLRHLEQIDDEIRHTLRDLEERQRLMANLERQILALKHAIDVEDDSGALSALGSSLMPASPPTPVINDFKLITTLMTDEAEIECAPSRYVVPRG